MKAAAIFLTSYVLLTQVTFAAWHDRYAGTGINVHHVQLVGHGGDNTIALRDLADAHQSCLRINASFGRTSQPLPASGLPKWVSAFEIDIYYASNRTLEVSKNLGHSIDPITCALDAKETLILSLYSAAGKCDANVAKKTASGQCDSLLHAKSIPIKPNDAPASISSALAKIDLSKLPPELRAKIEAGVNGSNTPGQAANRVPAPQATSLVAGHQCRVYQTEIIDSQYCVAQPTPQTMPNLNPFPIPPATLNGHRPGVLLEIKSLAMTVTAKVVNFSIAVSPDLFTIPSDYKRISKVGG